AGTRPIGERITSALLLMIASLAIIGCAVLVYGFVFKGWRLNKSPISSGFLTTHPKESEEAVAGRHWDFPAADSQSIELDIAGADIHISPASEPTISIQLSL